MRKELMEQIAKIDLDISETESRVAETAHAIKDINATYKSHAEAASYSLDWIRSIMALRDAYYCAMTGYRLPMHKIPQADFDQAKNTLINLLKDPKNLRSIQKYCNDLETHPHAKYAILKQAIAAALKDRRLALKTSESEHRANINSAWAYQYALEEQLNALNKRRDFLQEYLQNTPEPEEYVYPKVHWITPFKYFAQVD